MKVYRNTPSTYKHTLLYLMGKTWKHDTMFNSAFIQNNMQTLLHKSGIQTISVEYEKQDTFVSLHNEITKLSEEADYILGYSFGGILAVCSATENIKGIILLDPYVTNGNNAENFVENKNIADLFFQRDISNKNEQLSIANFPISHHKPEILVIFSEYGSNNNELEKYGQYLNYYRTINKIVIDNSSHFLMLESARFYLADIVSKFVNK